MITTLFVIGLLTALICGFNSVISETNWRLTAIWSLSAFGGAGLMVLAVFLKSWGL